MTSEAERLAAILVDARRSTVPVDGSVAPWSEMTAELAGRVGAAYARQTGAVGSPYWKLGAVDEATQQRLGVSGPLFAPLDPGSVSVDVTTATVQLSSLIAPRFEAEIGVLVDGSGRRAMPCVEVADSRFTDWSLPPWGVVADGTLQGHMLFGEAVDPIDVISVTILHDGREVSRGTESWQSAADRLQILPTDQPLRMVATGALTPLHACTPGSWTFDFGPLGQILVRVM